MSGPCITEQTGHDGEGDEMRPLRRLRRDAGPPRERPRTCATAPFSAKGGPLRFGGAAISRPTARRDLQQTSKKRLQDATLRPAVEAVVDNGRGSVGAWCVLPLHGAPGGGWARVASPLWPTRAAWIL